jgi:hypothetical protein
MSPIVGFSNHVHLCFELHQVINRCLFIFLVVAPYFICLCLSIVCSLYVVKALLRQTRRINRIHSTTIQLSTIPTTFHQKYRSASHFGDLGLTSQNNVNLTTSTTGTKIKSLAPPSFHPNDQESEKQEAKKISPTPV